MSRHSSAPPSVKMKSQRREDGRALDTIWSATCARLTDCGHDLHGETAAKGAPEEEIGLLAREARETPCKASKCMPESQEEGDLVLRARLAVKNTNKLNKWRGQGCEEGFRLTG